MREDEEKWFVMCGPQSRIDKFLGEREGDEAYAPRRTERRRAARQTRRMETITIPQYPGYMFARGGLVDKAEGHEYRLRKLVWRGSPALVSDAELDYARELEYFTAIGSESPRPAPEGLKVGQRVEVLDGILAGRRARVCRADGDLYSVQFEGGSIPIWMSGSRLGVCE